MTRRQLIGMAAAAAILAAGGVAIGLALGSDSPADGSSGSVPTFTIRGSISISNNFAGSIRYEGTSCRGGGGFSDLTPGTAVTVKNGTGQVVATGALGTTVTAMTTVPSVVAGLPNTVVGACTLNFAVQNVPGGLDAYVLTVSHRGDRVLRPAEARGDVKLTVG